MSLDGSAARGPRQPAMPELSLPTSNGDDYRGVTAALSSTSRQHAVKVLVIGQRR